MRSEIQITKVAQLTGHRDAVYDFVIDPKSERLYSAGADGYVVAWHHDKPAEGELILRTAEALYCIDLCDGVLSAGSRSGKIYRVDLESRSLLSEEQVHSGGVFFIDGRYSGGEDGMLVGPNGRIQLSKKSLRTTLVEEDHRYVGSSDGNIYILNEQDEVVRMLEGHDMSVFALEKLDGNYLLSAGRDAQIRLWDITIGKTVKLVSAHWYQIKSLARNDGYVLSSSMDKTIKLWDEELELLKVVDFARNEGHTNCINRVRWFDENMFVSCSDDRSLILWQFEIKS